VIRLESVNFAYCDKPVLTDVSFVVEPGQTKVILGSSGSGKSTILKIILGLLRPQSGQVRIDGIEITGARPAEIRGLRRKMGMVFQGGALFDSLTVGENIAYYLLEYSDKSPLEIERTVREILDFVGLAEDLIDAAPDELSGGMQRRVAIGRAVAAENPAIMLYDEPTTGLDPLSTMRIIELINKLQREKGVSSIIVTHQIRDAFNLANQFILLHRGGIVFEGNAGEFLSCEDDFVEEFLRPYLASVRALPIEAEPPVTRT